MNPQTASHPSALHKLVGNCVAAVPTLANRLQISPSALAAFLLLALTWALVGQGHAPSRWAQLLLLALPGILLLIVPISSSRLSLVRNTAVFAWVSVFAIDSVMRAFLSVAYQAAPDSSLVIGAVANTNVRESTEFLRMLSPTALLWAMALPFTFIASLLLVIHGAREGSRPTRIITLALIVILTLSALAYVFKAPRRLHPMVFWSGWIQSVQSTRASWEQMELSRQQIQAFAEQLQPKLDSQAPSTVVLVISDSVNRDNLGLYGYSRATTPLLTALKGQLGDELLVLKNAWAVEASTLPALNKIFSLQRAAGQDSDPAHIIAMAKAAGYKTWWISNHDDIAIEQQHAKLADVVEFENRVPGRSGDSLDSAILDCVEEALAESHQRKFIIVHLLGAHPHYGLRYPGNKNPFLENTDAIDIQLAKEGRSTWTRYMREEYDAAILYHDRVVSEIFKMTKADNPERPGEYRAWMYLSDHGQEVGHSKDFAGHSPNTAAGYRIPVVIWRNQDWPQKRDLASSSFRSDWTSWTLADLLNLRWNGYSHAYNILSANYEWQPPLLPIQVQSYTE